MIFRGSRYEGSIDPFLHTLFIVHFVGLWANSFPAIPGGIALFVGVVIVGVVIVVTTR